MSGDDRRIECVVDRSEHTGMRVDVYISEILGLCSRSQIKGRITSVIIDGKETKLSRKVKLGDRFEIRYADPPPLDLVPEKMNLVVLFENAHVIVIDKPQGLVVHPGSGNWSGTLLNGILHHCEELKENFSGSPVRPGIVHRLDKETSGVIIVAKDPETHEFLSNQFRKRRVRKTYAAIVKGTPPEPEATIETFIERDSKQRKRFTCSEKHGKHAVTDYRLVRFFPGYSLVRLRPRTGRTHQLRVHMVRIACPILGDPLYSRKDRRFPEATLMLHAYSLSIKIPGEKKKRRFVSRLPDRFIALFRQLEGGYNG
jgi:23S rRNA pseudouridine1911/1915/1917 synthase